MRTTVTKYLFLLTIFLTPLYLVRITLFHVPTNAHEILMIFCILLGTFDIKKDIFSKFLHHNRMLWFGIFILLAGLTTSMIHNGTYVPSMGIIKGWFIIPLLFSATCLYLMKSTRDIHNICIWLFVSISIVSVISLIEFAFGDTTYDGRLRGFYNSPNYLAMFLAPGIFIWAFMRQAKQISTIKRITFDISIILILLSLYFTYSYAGWISVFLALLLSIMTTQKAFPKKTALSAAIILFSFIFFQISTEKFSSLTTLSERSSLASRMMIWKSAEKILEDNILFGIGSGNFQQKYLEYQKFFIPYLEWAVPHPHNLLLSFWLQSGILGVFGFVVILIWIFKNLFLLKKNNHQKMVFFSVLSCYYLYILIHGLTDTTFWKNDLSLTFWLFTFALIRLSKEDLLQGYSIQSFINPIDEKECIFRR